MSNAGQAVLSIGGAAVGFIVGGPVGAAWGFQLGGLAGSSLFPTDLGTINGPRLNDLNVQSSAVGAPIPIVYGTYALSGNVIWSSGIIETVKKKRQGGKGGPSQTTKTYTYKVNCAVGVCEGTIGAITRIWADAKLIYDARAQLDDETDEDYATRLAANAALLANTEIYLGTADQLADPTIESFEGAGNVSGFRDLAYVVFSEFQLDEYGNRVPNFRFEVSAFGLVCEDVTEYSNDVLFPWLAGAIADPRNPLNDHTYRNDTPGYGTSPWGLYESAVQDIEDNLNSGPGNVSDVTIPRSFPYWSNLLDGHRNNNVAPFASVTPGEQVSMFLVHWWREPDAIANQAGGANACDAVASEVLTLYLGDPPAGATALYYKVPSGNCVDSGLNAFFTPTGSFACVSPSGSRSCEYAYRGNVAVARVPRPPDNPVYPRGSDALPTYSYATGYFVLNGTTVITDEGWVSTPGAFRALQAYADDGSDVTSYPLNPLRPVGHSDDTESFWTAAYGEAVVDGVMASGLTYGVDYPVNVSAGWVRLFSRCAVNIGGGIQLGQIVNSICRRCGLDDSQVDVSDLTELVDGYAIGTVMTGRAAIEPLRSYGFFDCVESDGVLRWPTRGKTAVSDIQADDLASHEAADSRPSAAETSRAQTVDLPRRLRLHYAQTAQNYEPGEQAAARISSGAEEVRDLEVAIAMSDTKAAQIADVVLYDLWVSRNTHRIVLDHSFLDLEPADAITAPIDGRQERLRIVNIDHTLPGLLQIEAVRDDDGVYVSYAIGAPAAYSGTGGGTISTPGTAELVLLDLPLLRDADNDAGYYAAIHSIGGTNWGGAVLFRSPDGGTTYEEVATTAEEASVGRLVSALPSGPTTIIDEGNELFVDMDSGELESVSEASLLAGLNAAAIGADGRWEIIQFRDAVLSGSPNSWQLTGLLRGRRGTEWAVGSSQAGDKFVLLDSALMRVAMNLSAIGTEREHKAVLSGTSLDASTTVDFTGQGVALEPFSVTDVTAERSGGDLVISWIRRGRIGSELAGSGVDIPLSEETEAYEIDIIDAGSPGDVLRTLTSSTQSATYTEAQQAADFGSPTPAGITVRIYQMSAAVGRGYPTEATL